GLAPASGLAERRPAAVAAQAAERVAAAVQQPRPGAVLGVGGGLLEGPPGALRRLRHGAVWWLGDAGWRDRGRPRRYEAPGRGRRRRGAHPPPHPPSGPGT